MIRLRGSELNTTVPCVCYHAALSTTVMQVPIAGARLMDLFEAARCSKPRALRTVPTTATSMALSQSSKYGVANIDRYCLAIHLTQTCDVKSLYRMPVPLCSTFDSPACDTYLPSHETAPATTI
jgi:hypothetical protein